MSSGRGDPGLFPGTPPYRWWHWAVLWIASSAAMFVILELAGRFHHAGLNVLLALAVGAVCVICTRLRRTIRERRSGHL